MSASNQVTKKVIVKNELCDKSVLVDGQVVGYVRRGHEGWHLSLIKDGQEYRNSSHVEKGYHFYRDIVNWVKHFLSCKSVEWMIEQYDMKPWREVKEGA